MAQKSEGRRASATSTDSHLEVNFELDEETQKEIIDCIRRTGKVSLQLRSAGVSKLPGRGTLDDVEGKLID